LESFGPFSVIDTDSFYNPGTSEDYITIPAGLGGTYLVGFEVALIDTDTEGFTGDSVSSEVYTALTTAVASPLVYNFKSFTWGLGISTRIANSGLVQLSEGENMILRASFALSPEPITEIGITGLMWGVKLS
jgi:hypothetical protein